MVAYLSSESGKAAHLCRTGVWTAWPRPDSSSSTERGGRHTADGACGLLRQADDLLAMGGHSGHMSPHNIAPSPLVPLVMNTSAPQMDRVEIDRTLRRDAVVQAHALASIRRNKNRGAALRKLMIFDRKTLASQRAQPACLATAMKRSGFESP